MNRTRPLMLLLGLVSIALGMAALFGTLALDGSILGQSQLSRIVSKNNNTAMTITTRGTSLPVSIGLGQSIRGLWASPDGLHFTLDGSTLSTVVIPPTKQSWKDEISYLCSSNCGPNNDMEISGSLTIPQISGSVTQTVNGKITGMILYPQNRDGATFANVTIPITVSVQLQLVSVEHYMQLVSIQNQSQLRVYFVGFGLSALFFLLSAVSIVILLIRSRRDLSAFSSSKKASLPLSSQTSTLHLIRQPSFVASVRVFRIILDGKKVGTIHNGGSFTLEIQAGHHTLFISCDPLSSLPLSFDIGLGENATFLCQLKKGEMGTGAILLLKQ